MPGPCAGFGPGSFGGGCACGGGAASRARRAELRARPRRAGGDRTDEPGNGAALVHPLAAGEHRHATRAAAAKKGRLDVVKMLVENNADGEREAAYREAEARERLAEAEANATETVSRAIAAGEMSAINYFIAQDYIKALQTIGSADNQKIIMLPLEATNLLGSIAGIGEIAKEVFGKDET